MLPDSPVWCSPSTIITSKLPENEKLVQISCRSFGKPSNIEEYQLSAPTLQVPKAFSALRLDLHKVYLPPSVEANPIIF